MSSGEVPLFSFALVGDTHVKPESGDQSAPWKVNERATARARFVAREIARYAPDFVVHLGDLVHPVPELPTFDEAVALTKQVFAQHHNALHVLPGNHDIGDKPSRMMPAKSVRASWIDIHERNFGPSWRSFDHGRVRFVLINTPVLNSGLPHEGEQMRWLEQTLAEAKGKRIFVFMHYPLFLLAPDEQSTYDNIDQPARGTLLALLRKHKVEAVFAGHVHNIFYHRLDGTEFYVMPATSFVRQDYSEMFRIEAARENGRDDDEKLGFAMIDVYPRGHAVNYLRTHGRELGADQAAEAVAQRNSALLPHPRKRGGAPIGAFMRHPWAEIVTLPQNGPMDEFVRKQARNDYPIAALWRMGVRHMRVPLADVIDPTSRQRMEDLVAIGHRFTVAGFGVPEGNDRALALANRHLIDRYECILPYDEIKASREALQTFRSELDRPLQLARVATSAEEVKVGSKIELFVSHGFRPDQIGEIEGLLADGLMSPDGFVIRAALGADLVQLCSRLSEWAEKFGKRLDVHLRIAANNPALNVRDDGAILRAVAELFMCALAFPRLEMIVDPFMDLDRGYFVRHGLVDRRVNLRPAGLAVEAMSAHLGMGFFDDGDRRHLAAQEVAGGRIVSLRSGARQALLVLPSPNATISTRDATWAGFAENADARAIPLDEPWSLSAAIGLSGSPSGAALPGTIDRPTLVQVDRAGEA